MKKAKRKYAVKKQVAKGGIWFYLFLVLLILLFLFYRMVHLYHYR